MPDDIRDPHDDALRLPPHSLEAEQSLLGALILAGDAFDRVADRVAEEDFYSAAHRHIFRATRGLALAGTTVDVITLAEALKDAGLLDKVGDLPYLGSLVQGCPSAASAEHYAQIVHDRAVRRRLLALSGEISDIAYARDGRSATDLVDELLRKVGDLAQSSAESEPIAMADLVPTVLESIERREQAGAPPGLPTGLIDLDEKILGLQPGELILVAGRPATGKTTLAMQFALHGAMSCGKPGLIFSLEMRPAALVERAIASLGRVNAHAMRVGQLDREDWGRISTAHGKIAAGAPLLIDGSPRLTVARLRSRAKRAARRVGLSIIIVDYLQLMDAVSSDDNRNEQLAGISRGLKLLANELGVPVVAISQLSRKCEERQDKRPMLSDLRDSGALEQDADVVIFVYRGELYNANDEDLKGNAEIIVAKHREGETGRVYATFLGQYNRFADTEWRPRAISASARKPADLDD